MHAPIPKIKTKIGDLSVEKSKEKRMTNDKTLATIMLLKMLNIIQCWS